MARKKKPTIDELIERSWLKPGGELHITADQKPALDKWVREHFKKTADNLFDSLEPKFKKITHKISSGETFDNILNQYLLKKNEIKNGQNP